MRSYAKVSPTIWSSDHFNALPSDDSRFVFIYLLSSPHSNSAGCYRLPDQYARVDLNWPLDRYQKAKAEVIATGMASFDAITSTVLIEKWWQFNQPANEKHRRQIEAELKRIPSPTLKAKAIAEYQGITPDVPQGEGKKPNGNGGNTPSYLETNHLNGARYGQ
jgi:hypothetical protein